MKRRTLLGLALAGAAGCECGPALPARDKPAPDPNRWVSWDFPPGPLAPEGQKATVLREPNAPLLIALHGRGEAGRGLDAGANGWRDDYDLDIAEQRLRKPPLSRADFHDLVAPKRLKAINQQLAQRPFAGLQLACPYAPALADRSLEGAQPYATFLVEGLLPRAAEELTLGPQGSERVGIDGVSMGGRLALWIGLSHPRTFASVGALQPAIGVSEASAIADLARQAQRARPGGQKLRLVSSEGDPFLAAVRALGHALEAAEVEHELLITPGPHDYIWNRGPGSYEMLLWHDRALRA